MKMRKTWMLIFCFAAIAASFTTQATPLQPSELPAEPNWFIHLDCDALKPTAIGQYLLAELEKPEAQNKLGAIQAILSFDPRKQLHAITLYSPTQSPDSGVMLVSADFDPDRLITLVKGANDYQSSTHGSHIIHSWIDDKKKPKNGAKPRVYGAIHGKHLIIISKHEAPVAAALDVLDRKSANLSSNKGFKSFDHFAGSVFLQAAAHSLNFSSQDPNAALLKMSKSLRLQIGESDHQLKGALSLEANDEEIAKNLASVAQGLAALVKLQQKKPEAMKLADALSVKQDGSAVMATLSLPTDDVVTMMKAGHAKKADKDKDAEKN